VFRKESEKSAPVVAFSEENGYSLKLDRGE
jgi:hypothetical protein